MNPEQTKATWQSLGMVAPMVGIVVWAIKTMYGVEIPVSVQGQVIDLINWSLPVLMLLAAWGRRRARAMIDRWL